MSNEEDKNITTDPVPSSKISSRMIFFIGFLLLIGIIGFVAYDQFTKVVWVSYKQEKQKMQQLQTTVTELENSFQSQKSTLQTLTDELNQLKTASTQSAPQQKDAWLAAEVRYLVKLADMNLQFRQSVPQAIALLTLADQDIRDATDARFSEVRKALASDIVDLQSVPKIDTAGIYMRLLALNEKVDQLPLMNKPTLASDTKQAAVSDEDLPWWKKGLKQSMESLRSIVVVRYNPSGKLPLVPPDQQAYLYQNWHAMLLNAMTALMQGKNDVYHASLQQALTWIKTYSIVDTPVAKAFIEELIALQAIDINPAMPKISRSLQAVEALT